MKNDEIRKVMVIRDALKKNACGEQVLRLAEAFGREAVQFALNCGGGDPHTVEVWAMIYSRFGQDVSDEELRAMGLDRLGPDTPQPSKVFVYDKPKQYTRQHQAPRMSLTKELIVLDAIQRGDRLYKDIMEEYGVTMGQFQRIRRKYKLPDLRGQGVHGNKGKKYGRYKRNRFAETED